MTCNFDVAVDGQIRVRRIICEIIAFLEAGEKCDGGICICRTYCAVALKCQTAVRHLNCFGTQIERLVFYNVNDDICAEANSDCVIAHIEALGDFVVARLEEILCRIVYGFYIAVSFKVVVGGYFVIRQDGTG